MANWTDYWRIVTPAARKSGYKTINMDDAYDLNTAGYASFASVSWFSNLMKGATARLQKYKQFDAMDSGDISRALDTIAEEISNADRRTNLPFQIKYQTEEDQEISDNVATTLRAALRHWSNLHELPIKIFHISRTLVKYGDCFFRKSSDTKKWEYVDPTRVMGIEINPETNEKVAYHVRPASYNRAISGTSDTVMSEIVPAKAMLHFTLGTDMGDSAPFGKSVLSDAVRDYRKLTMLEDAAIIYRIVRAPERRVFYIDVGNMPNQRVKQYIESIKNDIRQKRIPNTSTGNSTDSQYNPECLALDTEIPLLDGRTVTLQTLIDEHTTGKVNWAYSCDPQTGEVVPGVITWAGITRRGADRIKLTFDNGKSVTVTPDHKFPVRGRGFVEAQHLSNNDSLFPFNVRNTKMYGKSDYQQVWDPATKGWLWTHRVVANFMRKHDSHLQHDIGATDDVVHHVDFNRFNNSPSNLMFISEVAHQQLHRETKQQWWAGLTGDQRAQVVANISAGTKVGLEKLDPVTRARQIEKATQKIRAYHAQNQLHPTSDYTQWLADATTRIKALSNLEYIRELRRQNGKSSPNLPGNQPLKVSQSAISRMVEIIKHNDPNRQEAMRLLSDDEVFMSIFETDNQPTGGKVYKIGNRITDKYLRRAYSFVGVNGWKEFKQLASIYNHKIVSIERVEPADVGTITIDGRETFHGHHTFALAAGVFTKNSIQEDYFFPTTAAGRGSRVETLPGGVTWETPELDYFLNKVFRALRVPTSYMKGQDGQGAQYNDGKVGIAYIEELRFANYILRLQKSVETVLDEQFKIYLAVAGINLDVDMFKLELPEPQNFALYRQAALDADLINTFKAIEDTKYLSKRFMLKRYLGLTEDDIQMNETMLKQERSIEDGRVDELQQMYDPAVFDNRSEVTVPEGEESTSSAGEPAAEPTGSGDQGLPQ